MQIWGRLVQSVKMNYLQGWSIFRKFSGRTESLHSIFNGNFGILALQKTPLISIPVLLFTRARRLLCISSPRGKTPSANCLNILAPCRCGVEKPGHTILRVKISFHLLFVNCFRIKHVLKANGIF